MTVFRELRIEELRAEIEPSRVGRRAGDRGNPPLTAIEDPDQNSVVEQIEALKARADQALQDQLEQARRHWDQLEQTEAESALEAAVQSARTRFKEIAQRLLEPLNDARMEFQRRENEYFGFREDNDLDRQPAEPSRNWKLGYAALLTVIFLAESLINASFLAVGSEAGLLGGYGIAFGFSLVNVLPPFFLFGNAFRWIHHVDLWRRLLAWFATILLYLPLALTLNLALAHFRDASGELSEDVGSEAFRRFTEAPFSLQDMESWLLFLVGLFFSLISFYEGYKYRDPYPGYGKTGTKMEEAREAWYDWREEVVEELSTVRDQKVEEVHDVSRSVRRKPGEQRRILESRKALLHEYGEWLELLQRMGAILVQEYRDANRKARPDRGVPGMHEQEWRLSAPTVPSWSAEVTVAATPEEELEALGQRERAAIREITDFWDEVRQQIDPEGTVARA